MNFSYCTRLMFLAFMLVFAGTALADVLTGYVIHIADGDTVTVLDQSHKKWKIRLMGIDAPEKSQAFGNRSKQHLAELIFNKTVSVEYRKQDKYGRTVGKITFNNQDVNLEQVKAGLAWHYKRFQNEQSPDDRKLYALAEEEARAGRVGLWSDPAPMPPWDYRKSKKAGH